MPGTGALECEIETAGHPPCRSATGRGVAMSIPAWLLPWVGGTKLRVRSRLLRLFFQPIGAATGSHRCTGLCRGQPHETDHPKSAVATGKVRPLAARRAIPDRSKLRVRHSARRRKLPVLVQVAVVTGLFGLMVALVTRDGYITAAALNKSAIIEAAKINAAAVAAKPAASSPAPASRAARPGTPSHPRTSGGPDGTGRRAQARGSPPTGPPRPSS